MSGHGLAPTAGGGRPLVAPPTAGAFRCARGTVVGLAPLALALAGHVAAGGAMPAAVSLVAAGLVAAVVGVGLSGRRWSLASLLAVLLVGQAVFHTIFQLPLLGDPHGIMAGATGMDGTGHVHGLVGMDAAPDMAGLSAPGWVMIGCHLAAALVAALLLRRGEAWCWWVLGIFTTPLRWMALTAPVAVSWRGLLAPVVAVLPLRRLRGASRGHRRRGPPVETRMPIFTAVLASRREVLPSTA